MFDKKHLEGKKALVIGAGKSGISCAKLLKRKGFAVFLSEEKKLEAASLKKQLGREIPFETGGHSEKVFACDFAVKSPGIKPKERIIRALKQRKIPIFSEVEVAASMMPETKILAITGSNGKTTTCFLLSAMLKADGKRVHLCGNLGVPVSKVAMSARKGDFLVMEISSYQLADSTYFKPHICALLNIEPDHLAHHQGFANYIKAKSRIFKFQDKSNFCIINRQLEKFLNTAAFRSKKLFFSLEKKKSEAIYDGKNIRVFFKGVSVKFPPPKNLKGLHNVENAMAAILMALAAGCKKENMRKTLIKFKPVEHRLEKFCEAHGVVFINDSKSTNPTSTLAALKALSAKGGKKIHLILGGRDKGASYKILLDEIRRCVKKIYTIGEAQRKIENQLSGSCQIVSCTNLRKAVKRIFENISRNEIVLFSPACASFDQFRNFEHRGKIFKKMIKQVYAKKK